VNTSAKYRVRLIAVAALLIIIQSCRTPDPAVTPEPEPEDPRIERIRDAVNKTIDEMYETGEPVELTTAVEVDTILLDDEAMTIDIHMNERFSYSPLRPDINDQIYSLLDENMHRRFRNYKVTLYSLEEPISNLVPNMYRRSPEAYDRERMPYADELRPLPIVRRHDRNVEPGHGLEGRQIALWHSHGWYYEKQKQRWEWQRPRLFHTSEDLLPMAFTIPYLIPMLENAGAHVWVPRERDIQKNKVVVDFDSSSFESRVAFRSFTGSTPVSRDGHDTAGEEWEDADPQTWQTDEPGFAIGSPPYKDGENPFRMGSYRYIESDEDGASAIQWIPDIPEDGKYAVYISYASLEESAEDAFYSVYHRGGRTDFSVNQTIGGGTWVYLGHFEFDEGVNPEQGRVDLVSYSQESSLITADAVRFGGGMGNIEREGQTGGRPRYLEAARYHLQYSGMPDSLVYALSDGRSDVVDDFQGRGEWVNYLRGAPYGPNKDRDTPGLGIPIDASLSFHTDAGITRNDTVVGTLMIYSIEDGDSLRRFPDEVSRLTNRDFADIMQTEIVEDIRSTWDPAWNRRHLFNRKYSEAFRPNVPAVLLELLSHQNFLDMQYALDPRFRFDVSRTLYKSMLRFISDRYQVDYIVQPLPVSNFRITATGDDSVRLRWNAVSDTLEPTADPDRYIVYKKKGDKPFDNGRITEQTQITVDGLTPGEMYQFKVVAANDGGKSFPSEKLAVSLQDNPGPSVLIVNGFERVSGPAIVDEPGFKGFANFSDRGVPDRYDISFTGDQFDFDPDSEWLTNDAPGHGASYADYETRVIPGNSFAFPAVYGESLQQLGLSFSSASMASIRDRQVDMSDYDAVILIFGMQKSTPWPKQELLDREPAFPVFPERTREEIARYLKLGGRLFISGAHVGSDAADRAGDDPGVLDFIQDTLGYSSETNHAARTGDVRVVSDSLLPVNTRFSFNTEYHRDIYITDAPDAIEPYGDPVEPGVSSVDDGGAQNDALIMKTADTSGTASEETIKNKKRLSTGNLYPSGPETLIRFEENQFSAGVGKRTGTHAVVTFGFPFETIKERDERRLVLEGVMKYLGVLEAAD